MRNNPAEIVEYLGLNCNELEIKQAPCVQNFVFRKTGHVYGSLEDFDFSLRDILANRHLVKRNTRCYNISERKIVSIRFWFM